MSSINQYKQQRDEFQFFWGTLGDQLERVTGFVQRTSDLTGSKLVQILTLGSLEHGRTSLRGFCRVADELGIPLSEAGLHQRLNATAVELLRQISQTYLAQKSPGQMKAILAPFPRVHIVDSTEIRLPDHLRSVFRGTRSASSLKVQLAYEYKQGHIEAFAVEAGCQPDQTSGLGEAVAESGDLMLFDLGYFDQKRFARLDAAGVFFVSRLHSQAGLYATHDSRQALSLLEVVRGHGPRGELAYYLGSQERRAVRVLYYRLPADLVAERRRKAHETARNRGTMCSQHSLESLEWLFFITNAPAECLSLDHVAEVYRLRWQIEVVFKVWKSEMHIAYFGAWRIERILVQFYARLLALLLFHRLLETYAQSDKNELSMIQAYQLLRTNAARLIRIVKQSFRGFLSFLNDFMADLRRFAVKTKRRKHPSSFARLLALVA
jgi:hypothetical protein